MKSGKLLLRLLRPLGREPRHRDEQGRDDDSQHRPEHRRTARCASPALFPDLGTPLILYPSPGCPWRPGELCALRYGVPDGHVGPGRPCADSHETRAVMRVCGPHHAEHSSDRGRGSLCRAGGRPGRVCDTRGRPRGSPAGGRRGGWRSRGLGGRTAQGRARGRCARAPAPLARGRGRRHRRDLVGRRDHLAGRRPERRRRAAARGAATAAA